MKQIVQSVTIIALIILIVYVGVWRWGFCRFYVGADEMAILTAKEGRDLPAGQILAERGQKGVQREVLGEGRHFFNPYLFDHEIRQTQLIPAGKVGVVLSKVGKPLPQGEFLAGPGEQGVWRQVLGPGRYRLNPHGYEIEIVDAISIPIGYAGVMTSLSGTRADEGAFAGSDQKGVREEILQPGLYYINPRQYKVDVLEIGINQVSLLGREGGRVFTKNVQVGQNAAMAELQSNIFEEQNKQRSDYIRSSRSLSSIVSRPQKPPPPAKSAAQSGVMRQAPPAAVTPGMSSLGLSEFVEFPSRDGFQIRLDMTVEVELLPAELAGIFRAYGDLPALVDKIILPQIMSISRNKGSEYGAKDFIVGEGREKFQNDLKSALALALGEKRVIVHNALIRHVDVPAEILAPIQQASIAIEQDLTNKERQNTARRQAELNTQQALIEQARQQVEQETSKLQAEIRADMEKQVAEVQAEAKRQVAQIIRDAAATKADTVRKLAQAEAASLELVAGERARGLQLKTASFGDPQAFALWTLAMNLNPAIRVRLLHAGEGTLWTDLEKATFGDLGGARIIQPAKP